MKKSIALSVLTIILLPLILFGQEKSKVKIVSVKEKGEDYLLAITSSKPFYVGGNVYVLHIGNENYDLYDQVSEEGGDTLVFHVPVEALKNTRDNERMYLTYGELGSDDEDEMEKMNGEADTPCWKLGRYSKKLLPK
jgi:hypothetical protein